MASKISELRRNEIAFEILQKMCRDFPTTIHNIAKNIISDEEELQTFLETLNQRKHPRTNLAEQETYTHSQNNENMFAGDFFSN